MSSWRYLEDQHLLHGNNSYNIPEVNLVTCTFILPSYSSHITLPSFIFVLLIKRFVRRRFQFGTKGLTEVALVSKQWTELAINWAPE